MLVRRFQNLGFICVVAAGLSSACSTPRNPSVIPQPVQMEVGRGIFDLDADTRIVLTNPTNEVQQLTESWARPIRATSGFNLQLVDTPSDAPSNTITLRLSRDASHPAEGYRLNVTSDVVTVEAKTPAGLFYGLQTLTQLLSGGHSSGWSVPVVQIVDAPRFAYRGMHLDVGRHFFPVAFVKKYIDLLAMYKMNKFHWHLTDDQGWRIEIKKYPKLTEIGAYRKETVVGKNFERFDRPYVGDGQPHGGFYTQDEVREVVAYARARYIDVIPEIEMPGHATAALAAYPELACTDGPFNVPTTWGIFEDVFCPKEETFQFLEDVLTEVIALFPSQYIHIGGDEVLKVRWKESELAQEVITREGLADEDELQSYFIKRIESFLLAQGRRLIGWDEILEGGLAPDATVMSWRGMEGGIEAARQGHDVIMTPTSHTYFDYYQGDPVQEPLAIRGLTPLEKVYGFEPVPETLSAEDAAHILGAQGNVWTEYMATTDHVEYMVFPRMLALAEVVWSPQELRNWEDFVQRLPAQLQHLDTLGVNYRQPEVGGGAE
jgi:hexosaminidase